MAQHEEFTRVELNRRIAVMEGVMEAFTGHVTVYEFEGAGEDAQRRKDIRDLVKSLGHAARDVDFYAVKLYNQLGAL